MEPRTDDATLRAPAEASWPSLAAVEVGFLRTLNRLIEPAVRAGCGFPCVSPTGLIVLETKGRRSGMMRRTPVVATDLLGHLLVGTVRGQRSDWMRNLRAAPDVRYWLRGQLREARAVVFEPDRVDPSSEELPGLVRLAAVSIRPTASLLGYSFAILSPAR